MKLDLSHHQSPFDAIRQGQPDGHEYWSARDLMPLMGYSAWRNFEVPLERAKKAAGNQGHDIEANFARSRKVAGARGPAQQDYQLSRFAAYLVAMNGDPNMPEVAAAQSYFAIRTREAEMKQPRTIVELSRLDILKLALAAEEEKAVLQAQLEITKPKVDAYDAFLDADGTYTVGTVAKMCGLSQNKLFILMRNAGVLIAKGPQRNTPYQRYMHHFVVKATEFQRSDGTHYTSYTTRVQPSGVDFLRRKFGLVVEQELQVTT